jgi:hypothetical protein
MAFDWLRLMPRRRPGCAPAAPRRFRPTLETLEDRRTPATFTVNTTLDADDGSPFDPAGTTSLRKAVRLSNVDQVPDTIAFAPELATATIGLTGGQLTITKPTNIVGPAGGKVTIDGNGQARIFNVDDLTQTRVAVTLAGLRLTRGRANDGGVSDLGGAIRNRENLVIVGCTFDHNAAPFLGGAVFNAANAFATITDSTFSTNTASAGGAIYSDGQTTVERVELLDNEANTGGAIAVDGGTLSVIDSVIRGNIAVDGGAIQNDTGAVTIDNSTIVGNSAEHRGGGLNNNSTMSVRGSTLAANAVTASGFGEGGGAVANANTGTLSMSNSTVSGNVAFDRGGGILNNGDTTLDHCTVVGNRVIAVFDGGQGGGIRSVERSRPVTTRLHHTIVAGNSAADGPDLVGTFDVADSAFNLIGDPGSAGGLTNGVNGNVVGHLVKTTRVLLPLPLILDPVLRNNGGRTETHALIAGSAAIDAGDPNHVSVGLDQRGPGFLRIKGARVDIGAYEMPRPAFADDFNRVDRPGLGAAWSARSGRLAVAAAQAQGAAGRTGVAVVRGLNAPDVDLYATPVLGPNQQAGLVARYSAAGGGSYYLAALRTDADGITTARLARVAHGVVTDLAAAESVLNSGLRFRVIGSHLELFAGRTLVASADDAGLRSGLAGIHTVGAAQVDDFAAFPVATGVDHLDLFDQPDGSGLGPPWAQAVGSYHVQAGAARGEKAVNLAVVNGARAADVDVRADVTVAGVNGSVGLLARYLGGGDRNYYLGSVTRTATGFIARVVKNVGGVSTVLSAARLDTPTGAATLRFLVTGTNLRLFVNDRLMADVLDRSLAAGSVGIRSDPIGTIGSFRATAVTAGLPFDDAFDPAEFGGLGAQWTRRVGRFATTGGRAVGSSAVNLAVAAGLNQASVIVQADINLPEVNDEAGLVACYAGRGDDNYYLARVRKTTSGFALALVRNVGRVATTLKSKEVETPPGRLTLIVRGNQVSLRVDQVTQLLTHDNALSGGGIGFRTAGGGTIDNLTAQSLVEPVTDAFPPSELGPVWVTRAGKFVTDNQARGAAARNLATLGRFAADDVVIEAEVDVTAPSSRYAGLVARTSGPGGRNMYQATVRRVDTEFVWEITKVVNGVSTTLAAGGSDLGKGRLRFAVVGGELTLFINASQVLSVFDLSLTGGGVGIRSSVDATFGDFHVGLPGT